MEEFLEIASHELKTPLTSLDGNIQLVARRLDDLSRQEIEPHDFTEAISRLRVLLQRCEPSLSRLGRLVNDLLDESSIRSGHLDLKLESCDLTAVVTQTIEEVCLIYPARPIHLVEQEKRPIHVMADPERLEQVVCNYLSNAIKYSREDQPVQVRIQRSNGMARVSVRDDGPSVPANEQPLIWERYYRAEGVDVQSGSDVGVGLGLYIAKAIVERHGGQVGMTSEPGAGSTFWFTIPLAPTTLENGTAS
jgi:signal transduction histidine kinase